MRRRTQVLVVIAVVAVGALYISGTFDRPLSSVGLNYHECARNGLGATFCGEELTEYRERIARGKREGEAAKRKINEESARREQAAEVEAQKAKETVAKDQREYQATAKQQQEELTANEEQLRVEGEETQQTIRESG